MKKTISIFLLGILFSIQTKAQGFVHTCQMPMYYNPSFAGSKGVDRLSVLTNYKNIKYERSQNNYASFDLLSNKLGSGIGVAFYNFNSQQNYPNTYYYIDRISSYNTCGINLAFAPKYLIKKKDGSVRATFSPSLGVGFSGSNVKYKQIESYKEYAYILGINPLTSISSGIQHNKVLETSLGFLYNSKYLLLGFTVTNKFFSNDFINKVYYPNQSDTVRYWSGEVPKQDEVSYNTWRDNYSFSSLDSIKGKTKSNSSYQLTNFYFSYIIKYRDKSKFSVTPLLQLGVAYVPNLPKGRYSNDLEIYSLNINTTVQYGKLLLGVGINTDFGNNFYAGFQNEKMRIMIGGYSKSLELSFNYYFKRNE